MIYQFLLPLIFSALIAFAITPLVIRFARRFKLVDNPQKRTHPAHTHVGTIPRAGGLAILLGILIPIGILLPINKALLGIIFGAILTTCVGLFDDRKDISPYLRLFFNLLTALIVVGAGIGIPYITNPLGGIIRLDTIRISFDFLGPHSILLWADLFAVVWIMWSMNIIGWSSGVDGQMPGFVAIAALVLGLMSARFSAHDISQTTVAMLGFITAGAFLGFLPWNFYPQKIMPGYGGKSLAGFLLAVLAILSGNKVGSALLILALPMLDASYTLFRRMARGKSPFHPDRYHLHHRLLDLGWGKRRIALFYWGVSAILGILTLTMNSQQKSFTFIAVAVIVGGGLIWLTRWFSSQKETTDT